MFNNFIAIGLYTDDFNSTALFYRDVLKLDVISFSLEKEFAEFTIGNITLGLISKNTAKELLGEGGIYFKSAKIHPSFTLTVKVDSTNELFNKINNINNIKIISPPHTTSWGWNIMLFKDINGCIWEACELPVK